METLIYIINAGAWLNYCAAQISSSVTSKGLNQTAWIAISISAFSILFLELGS
jgi:hypothetical protein